jgi:hypothetical protein
MVDHAGAPCRRLFRVNGLEKDAPKRVLALLDCCDGALLQKWGGTSNRVTWEVWQVFRAGSLVGQVMLQGLDYARR